MQSRLANRVWMSLTIALLLSIGLESVESNAQPIEIYHERDVYIKMDFWKPRSEQSAEAWFFDPANGGQLTQLPNDPSTPTAPPRAMFTVERFFPERGPGGFNENHAWFIGVPEINVGIPGSNEASFKDLAQKRPTHASRSAHLRRRAWSVRS